MVISGCGGVDLRAHSRIARQGLPTTCHSCFLRPVSNLHHLKEVLLSPAKYLSCVMDEDERWYLFSATLCHAIPAETWINGAFRRIKKGGNLLMGWCADVIVEGVRDAIFHHRESLSELNEL